MGAFTPTYPDFDSYKEAELEDLSSLEQLLKMDSEIANYCYFNNYIGPIYPFDLRDLKKVYSSQVEGFIQTRLDGIVEDPAERTRPFEEEFGEFREGIAELNNSFTGHSNSSVTTLSRPAERLLTKALRQEGFDPSEMDLRHMRRDGTLYLLELFASAAQQEADDGTLLLNELTAAIDEFRSADKDELLQTLQYPVLMVSLWVNQQEGLKEWIDHGRSGILEMATATGKTVAGIGAIAHLCGVLPNHDFDIWGSEARTDDAEIAVIAHSNAILSQWDHETRDLLGLNIAGADSSGQPDPLSFATGTIEFHTIHSLLPQHGGAPDKQYDLVICDEAHHYANTSEGGFGDALDSLRTDAMLGLSATIEGEGSAKRQQLVDLLGGVVYTFDIEDAQEHNIIPEFEWTVHPTAMEPAEAEEWESKTNRISNLFTQVQNSTKTATLLKSLDVPFARMEDLGDFISAHKRAGVERDNVPDSWEDLHAAIQSRNWIRHRSRPKLEGAIELANEYLQVDGDGVKIVMFSMDIETTEEIGAALQDSPGDVFVVHSQVESSNKKKDETVRRRINDFKKADNAVLIAPKLLDEGVDVPDAEVGINVAGTKTELQLIQRMGRILRRHADQVPHFHHYVAVPEKHHLDGIDDKELTQQLYWVRELGERIGQPPAIEPAAVDPEVIQRAKQRGSELWAEELLQENEVEGVDGPLDLKTILSCLSEDAADVLLEVVDFSKQRLSESDWERGMQTVRNQTAMTPTGLQQIWWLQPIYQDNPTELKVLLESVDTQSDSSRTTGDGEPSSESTGGQSPSGSGETDTSRQEGEDKKTEESNGMGNSSADKPKLPESVTQQDLARLLDLAKLSPTSNGELANRWEMDRSKDAFYYIDSRLSEFYKRNDSNKIVLSEKGRRLLSEFSEL
jgi:superfamily II DNA or RNA helicase